MIVITGAAGFISSCLVAKLNSEGFNDLILVDDFSRAEKENNYKDKKYTALVDRNQFFSWKFRQLFLRLYNCPQLLSYISIISAHSFLST